MQNSELIVQDHLAGLVPDSENLRRVSAFRDRLGHESTMIPQTLLTLPIWLHHKTAANKNTHGVTWSERSKAAGVGVTVHRTVEQFNGVNPDRRPNEAGCLRYFDLDVLVGIGHAFMQQQSPLLTFDQAELLRWMGYTRELRPPRERVLGSLKRMTHVEVSTWIGNLDEDTNATTFRILGTAEKERINGNRSILTVGISTDWIQALRQGRWQEMDLDCYAHLVRNHRRAGLARVLYAALTAMRTDLTHFAVPYGVLAQRFSLRMPDGRYRYSDPNNENNPLRKALDVLLKSGVIEPDYDAAQEGIIAGKFCAKGVQRIVDQPRQTLLLSRDISGDVIERKTSEETAPPTSKKQGPQSLIRQAYPKLRSLIKVSKQVEDTALLNGWDEGDVARLYLIAWSRHSLGKIDNPGAWAAACLRDSWPENWSKDKINERADRPELVALLKQLVADDDDDDS